MMNNEQLWAGHPHPFLFGLIKSFLSIIPFFIYTFDFAVLMDAINIFFNSMHWFIKRV